MFLKIERKEVLQMEWIIGLAGLSFVIGCLCGRSDAAWPFYLIAAAFLVIALFGFKQIKDSTEQHSLMKPYYLDN